MHESGDASIINGPKDATATDWPKTEPTFDQIKQRKQRQ
jgi:hypothetical protein